MALAHPSYESADVISIAVAHPIGYVRSFVVFCFSVTVCVVISRYICIAIRTNLTIIVFSCGLSFFRKAACFSWKPILNQYIDLVKHAPNHVWPSTQPSRIAHILTAHRRAAHNPAARWCAGSVVCNFSRQQCMLAQRWPNVGTIVPKLGQRWANLDCCLTG